MNEYSPNIDAGLIDGLDDLEARRTNGDGNNEIANRDDFGAVGQTFVRIAGNSYADGTELMARARPLEWDPVLPLQFDPGLGRPVFANNPDDEVPQGRAGPDLPVTDENGNVIGTRIPLTDDLRFVNQPTGDLPQARDISVAVFDQDLDGDGTDDDLPTPAGTNDFHLFFGQALTHDMVETEVNVTAVSIPADTGIGWAGGTVNPMTGEPTAAVLARAVFNPQTGQWSVPQDAQGRPIVVPVDPALLEDPPSGGLPAATVTQNGTTVTFAAVSEAQLDAAWDAYVNHQALSLGAPFALQRTPGVYDEEGVRQQANTETAFFDLGNVYGKETTAFVDGASITQSALDAGLVDLTGVTRADGFVQIAVDTTKLLRKTGAEGALTAYLLTSDDVVDTDPGDGTDLGRDGFGLLPTYREVNVHKDLFRDVDGTFDPQTGAPIDEATASMGAVFDPTLEAFFDLDRFAAGDQRVNQNIATVTQQTVWMRNHNEWAEAIEGAHPDWSADEVFDLARALNEAEYQKAIYDEYLPTLIGEVGMAMIGEYDGYDPTANPAVINEWTTIAFRFGHDQSSNFVTSLMEDGQVAEQVALIESFTRAGEGAQASVPTPEAMDEWLRGQLSSAHQALDGYVVDGNRGELFGVVVSPVTGQPVINDLTVFDITRGRDHGVNSYVNLRQALGLDDYTEGGTELGAGAFDNWAAANPTLVTDERLAAIKQLYGNDFTKFDAYVGVLLEEKLEGSQLGASATMLVAMQFAATRDGDRFWYENRFADEPEVLALIEESTMAGVIARTSGIEHVYRDAFLAHERISGTDGHDRLRGTDGRDLLMGGEGNDRLQGRAGDDDLHGGAGDDVLLTGLGRDSVDAGAGFDRMVATESPSGVTIEAINPWSVTGKQLHLPTTTGIAMYEAAYAMTARGAWDYASVNDFGVAAALDHATLAVEIERIDMTKFGDVFLGRGAAELVFGRGGADFIDGRDGDDDLRGGDGDDQLFGSAGDDTLNGQDGDDRLEGGDGDDVLRDGGGLDTLSGGDGDDVIRLTGSVAEIDGGAGYDQVSARGSDMALVIDMAATGIERATGSDFDDVIDGRSQKDAVRIDGLTGADLLVGGRAGDLLRGGTGDDDLRGKAGADELVGNDGGDALRGDGGDDTLRGGDGADTLRGGDGDDVLIGGAGGDTFVFDDRDHDNNGGKVALDVIRDFEFGIDTATFRFDGRWFEGSGIATINDNQGAFSAAEDFLAFLSQVVTRDGQVELRGASITAHVVNPANDRELSYRFQGLEAEVIDGWLNLA
jgi:Ca2+-binding RTX toxin-like protein